MSSFIVSSENPQHWQGNCTGRNRAATELQQSCNRAHWERSVRASPLDFFNIQYANRGALNLIFYNIHALDAGISAGVVGTSYHFTHITKSCSGAATELIVFPFWISTPLL
jgi:hypothetical protein